MNTAPHTRFNRSLMDRASWTEPHGQCGDYDNVRRQPKRLPKPHPL